MKPAKEKMRVQELPDQVISHLWSDYIKTREKSTREKIVEVYANFAHMLAAKSYANRQVNEVEFNDYLQYARIGLLEAIDRYDPQQGTSFKAYASHWINGEILSGIEKSCDRQQQISLRARLRKERLLSLQEDANHSNLSLFEKLAELTVGLAIGYMLEDGGMYQTEEQKVVPGPYEKFEFMETRNTVRHFVARLSEQQKDVIKAHYYAYESFEKIGEKLGVTKGRVSQIHKQALLKIKEYWEKDEVLNISL